MTALSLKRLPTVAAALLYAALCVAANPAGALDAAGRAEVEALRAGDMRKLLVQSEPVAAPDVTFTGADGNETTLAASNGRVRLVNFWATWCAPCRQEMPALDRLQQARGGSDFEVITIATGRNSPDAIVGFLNEAGVTLPTALDPKSALAQAMDVPGLPVTVLLDRDGTEVARLLGGAAWDGPEAAAVLDYLIAAK